MERDVGCDACAKARSGTSVNSTQPRIKRRDRRDIRMVQTPKSLRFVQGLFRAYLTAAGRNDPKILTWGRCIFAVDGKPFVILRVFVVHRAQSLPRRRKESRRVWWAGCDDSRGVSQSKREDENSRDQRQDR